MVKLSIQDLDFKGKKVLMRVDFNVPIGKDGTVSDDTRICLSLPSIKYILKRGGSLILMSHLGRPHGKKEPKLSLKPCANHLSFLLQKEIKFEPDCIGKSVKKRCELLQPGEILLLENLRFHIGEEYPDKDPSFAKSLSELGEIYVNDAFGTAHRRHASTCTISQYFPNKSAVGFLMEQEVSFLSELLVNPKPPFYAILGGAKIGSKLGVLESLLSKIESIFIGGGMAFTFLKSEGIEIGDSLFDPLMLKKAETFLKRCKELNVNVYLPLDIVIAPEFSNDSHNKTVDVSAGIPQGWKGMDIGPKTIKSWAYPLEKAKTIFWNGPMGVFEMSNFNSGTKALTQKLSEINALKIVGGGDSVAAVKMLNAQKNFTHISTGGGASLEYLENGRLPGVDAISEK